MLKVGRASHGDSLGVDTMRTATRGQQQARCAPHRLAKSALLGSFSRYTAGHPMQRSSGPSGASQPLQQVYGHTPSTTVMDEMRACSAAYPSCAPLTQGSIISLPMFLGVGWKRTPGSGPVSVRSTMKTPSRLGRKSSRTCAEANVNRHLGCCRGSSLFRPWLLCCRLQRHVCHGDCVGMSHVMMDMNRV
jgi:hypothetical protein